MYFSSCLAVVEKYKHMCKLNRRIFFLFDSLWFDKSNLESKRMSREYHTRKINGSHYISLTAQ